MSRAALAGCLPFHATPPSPPSTALLPGPQSVYLSTRARAVCFYEDACLLGFCQGAARLTRAVSGCLAMTWAAKLLEQGK